MADVPVLYCATALCPETEHPGQTGCRIAPLEKKVASIEEVLNGPVGHPEAGFIFRSITFYDRQEKKHWKRSDKIAAAAVLAVCILPPAAWLIPHTVTFFKDLYGMAQEYEKLHKSEIQSLTTTGKVYVAHRDGHQYATIPEILGRRN
jgi:hypothetical protein